MILLNEDTRVIVQGITGNQGRFHTKNMLEANTNVVAGVTPGKKGQNVQGVPVFDSVLETVEEYDANASVIFIPAPFAKDAAFEAIDAGLKLVTIITEHIPVQDAIDIVNYGKKCGVDIIGPNTPGLASPKVGKMGIIPMSVLKEGNIGMVSRSGTLTYEVANQLTQNGHGQSTCVGIGGDPIIGLRYIEILERFEKDNETDAIVMIGEIGGSAEEETAEKLIHKMKKPVISYIAGQSAPEGKRMGHAGAIIEKGAGTAQSKMKALEEAGALVAKKISEIPTLINEVI
ncbi:succinate--CoA ligase subunit alpha [Methanococcus voltae]|uniref:Succinate--CoA ligase [ADP-forming] subunit alpha n=2 Tax=Methanococcus voltae TaxID=2188 RepID=A0A8J7UTP6_METVO|nr:succinate--CoA ligase subunit alpha [Methanococcus voltae]MBP2173035.1 succinyl-CoA synthetase alpha subunit [Methanococcus voltae]MBP2201909.1 succinyl-CoA synthetase alpha subunit [Methanococcus voltae]MCS3922073.1 succinyl-CoA synthetase alpha subunit [Methanococcus voltae PS]